jgi:hypothetical protein
LTRSNSSIRTTKVAAIGGRASILCLGILFVVVVSRADDARPLRFDIGAQSLSSALTELARQSQLQILFAPELVAQKTSKAIRGPMQPLAALRLLLQDSNLTITTTPNGAILIGYQHIPVAGITTPNALLTESPPNTSDLRSKSTLTGITVEGRRDREIVERQVGRFVSGLAQPLDDSPARWQRRTPICPLAAGLPRNDGEFMLARLSSIAVGVGAPVAPEHCKANFYVIVTSEPDALLEAWSKRDPWMFDEQAGPKLRKFLNSSSPIRVWYNTPLESVDGIAWHSIRQGTSAQRDLTSVIVVIDAPRTKGVNFGQLAAYVAMVGLAEIRKTRKWGMHPRFCGCSPIPEMRPR